MTATARLQFYNDSPDKLKAVNQMARDERCDNDDIIAMLRLCGADIGVVERKLVWTDAKLRKLNRMREDGFKPKQIAQHFKVSVQSVYGIIQYQKDRLRSGNSQQAARK